MRIQAEASGVDLILRSALQQINASDQKYRTVSNPHPPGSAEHRAFVETSIRTVSLNLVIKQAAEQGELPASNLALLVNRIRMRQVQPQVYGSQIVRDPDTGQWKLHAIEDEGNVNKRRIEVGLERLEDYALRFGIVWKSK